MDTYDTLNRVLVKLFNDILELEEKAIITGEFKDISVNDMHIIEAIGIGEGKNMSTIAKAVGITVGSLTIAMNGLVKKEYVTRERSEVDRRVVYIKLTEKGERALHHHAHFHKQMIDAIVKELSEDEIPMVTKVLDELDHFFLTFKAKEETQ